MMYQATRKEGLLEAGWELAVNQLARAMLSRCSSMRNIQETFRTIYTGHVVENLKDSIFE